MAYDMTPTPMLQPEYANRVRSKVASAKIIRQWAVEHGNARFQFIYGPCGTIVADGELAVLLIQQPDKMRNGEVYDVRGKRVEEILI